ncbi:hypothetical protein Lal_00000064 [Lupinus albus]|nr:hypothetical protein Lal_00000064 [Lupinus albus]
MSSLLQGTSCNGVCSAVMVATRLRLRNKLKQFADQYELSEQQHGQKLKQKSLELQLADLKIKQHGEKLAQEQSQMKVYAEQISQLLATEKNFL